VLVDIEGVLGATCNVPFRQYAFKGDNDCIVRIELLFWGGVGVFTLTLHVPEMVCLLQVVHDMCDTQVPSTKIKIVHVTYMYHLGNV